MVLADPVLMEGCNWKLVCHSRKLAVCHSGKLAVCHSRKLADAREHIACWD